MIEQFKACVDVRNFNLKINFHPSPCFDVDWYWACKDRYVDRYILMWKLYYVNWLEIKLLELITEYVNIKGKLLMPYCVRCFFKSVGMCLDDLWLGLKRFFRIVWNAKSKMALKILQISFRKTRFNFLDEQGENGKREERN